MLIHSLSDGVGTGRCFNAAAILLELILEVLGLPLDEGTTLGTTLRMGVNTSSTPSPGAHMLWSISCSGGMRLIQSRTDVELEGLIVVEVMKVR